MCVKIFFSNVRVRRMSLKWSSSPKSDWIPLAKSQIRLNKNYCVIWTIKIYLKTHSHHTKAEDSLEITPRQIFFSRNGVMYYRKKEAKEVQKKKQVNAAKRYFFNHFFDSFLNFYTIDKYYYYFFSSSFILNENKKKVYKPLVSISCRTFIYITAVDCEC